MGPLEAPPIDQRARILDTALHLMAANGAHAMSMRSLAAACDLNVATLYHYFGSKADLLAQVVAHRDYPDLLPEIPPVDAELPPRARLAALLAWLWGEMATQDDMWRLLLGESLRGDGAALGAAADLSILFESALTRWLTVLFADLSSEPVVTARVLRGVIYGFFIEHLPLGLDDRQRLLARRADEVAAVLIPV